RIERRNDTLDEIALSRCACWRGAEASDEYVGGGSAGDAIAAHVLGHCCEQIGGLLAVIRGTVEGRTFEASGRCESVVRIRKGLQKILLRMTVGHHVCLAAIRIA